MMSKGDWDEMITKDRKGLHMHSLASGALVWISFSTELRFSLVVCYSMSHNINLEEVGVTH